MTNNKGKYNCGKEIPIVRDLEEKIGYNKYGT